MTDLWNAILRNTPMTVLPEPPSATDLQHLRRTGRTLALVVGLVLLTWLLGGALVLHTLATGMADDAVSPGVVRAMVGLYIAGLIPGSVLFTLGIEGVCQTMPVDDPDCEALLACCDAFPEAAVYQHAVLAQHRPFCRLDLRLVKRHQPAMGPNARLRLYGLE